MASGAPSEGGPSASALPSRSLLSREMLLWVWLPIALIGALHYGTSPDHPWAHDILRRLYYLPIVVAAFQLGLRGGLAAAVAVSLTYLPHAFLHTAMSDPGRDLEKALEVVLYNAVGAIAGYLADAERRRRAELMQTLDELRHALEEQRRLTKQLVRAGRLSALGEVVAGIAHEVKNPLHALAGTAEVVDPLIPRDAEERHLWELHVGEIGRLQRVAERFLSFARPRPIEAAPVDLRQVVKRLYELVSAQARQLEVRLELSLPDEPATVLGDLDQLAQLAMNIVLNGFEALSGRGGVLRMAVEPGSAEESAMHRLVIENDGPEIAEEMLEHIFDPFSSGREEGSGLGLSIASRIAEGHGGYIDVANAGFGVEFTVFLPAHRGSSDEA